MPTASHQQTRYWSIARALLFAAFIITAALDMMKVRAGFATSYLADITVPALLYIVTRGLHNPTQQTLMQRFFGRTPEVAALTILGGSVMTEVSQIYWPTGLFAGRYDPYDIAAYVAGVGVCYGVDKAYTYDKRS